MDGDRFDTLTQAFGGRRSPRRALLAPLAGGLGLLGLKILPVAGKSPKRCKGLKGKKKRKCLAKPRPDVCRVDADCVDKTDACRNGTCQRICPTGACADNCTVCLVHLEADGQRKRLCAGIVELPNLAPLCATDADCSQGAPLCVFSNVASCTFEQCGTCAISAGACGG